MDFIFFAEFGITGIIIGAVVSAALGAAMSAMSKPKIPGQQGIGEISAGATRAELEVLPHIRELEAAARMGESATVPTGEAQPVYENQPSVMVRAIDLTREEREQYNVREIGTWAQQAVTIPYNEADWSEGGRFYKPGQPNPSVFDQRVITGYRTGEKTVDFSGLGDADIQAELTRQMAPAMLELEKKYGPEFIALAKDLMKQADPEGVAAREQLAQMISEQAEAEPDRPVAELLNRKVEEELAAGGALNPETEVLVREALASRVGDTLNADEIIGKMSSGVEGLERKERRTGQSLGWLTSGATPDDVNYRRTQQSMANMASFLGGKTPQSQFRQLSGAQAGATPRVFGPDLPGFKPPVDQFTAQAANQYNTQANINANQADSWFGGLSMLLRGAGGVFQTMAMNKD